MLRVMARTARGFPPFPLDFPAETETRKVCRLKKKNTFLSAIKFHCFFTVSALRFFLRYFPLFLFDYLIQWLPPKKSGGCRPSVRLVLMRYWKNLFLYIWHLFSSFLPSSRFCLLPNCRQSCPEWRRSGRALPARDEQILWACSLFCDLPNKSARRPNVTKESRW